MHISKDCVEFLMPHEGNGKCYSSVWIRAQMNLSNFKHILLFFIFWHLSINQNFAVPGAVCCPAAQLSPPWRLLEMQDLRPSQT